MSELTKYLLNFLAFDSANCQCYIVAHSMAEAVDEAERNPNCREIIRIEKISEAGPKNEKAIRLCEQYSIG